MRLLIILLILLIAGCMEPQPQTTSTTTETLPAGPSIDESRAAALAVVVSEPNFAKYNCSTPKEATYDPLPCPACWFFNFTFVCGREIRGAYVTVDGLRITGYAESAPMLTCYIDGDCLGTRPTDNVRMACRKGICEQVPFDDPATKYCLNMSHKVRTYRQPSGATYMMCAFVNGNACEVWSYYFKRCGVNTGNLSDCTNYPSGYICQPDYTPVCAKLKVGVSGNATTVWRPSASPCMACTSGEKNEEVTGYVMGDCPPTTTIPNHISINPAATFCEEHGYAYRLKRYATGREYGVCVFSLDDQCEAEDFFHGRCGPKNQPL